VNKFIAENTQPPVVTVKMLDQMVSNGSGMDLTLIAKAMRAVGIGDISPISEISGNVAWFEVRSKWKTLTDEEKQTILKNYQSLPQVLGGISQLATTTLVDPMFKKAKETDSGWGTSWDMQLAGD